MQIGKSIVPLRLDISWELHGIAWAATCKARHAIGYHVLSPIPCALPLTLSDVLSGGHAQGWSMHRAFSVATLRGPPFPDLWNISQGPDSGVAPGPCCCSLVVNPLSPVWVAAAGGGDGVFGSAAAGARLAHLAPRSAAAGAQPLLFRDRL